MIQTAATTQRLALFNDTQVAKENTYPNRNNNLVEKYASKQWTNESLADAFFKIEIINFELTLYNFMLYQKMQDLMRPIKEEMEKLNYYHHAPKKVYNDAMIEINALCTACRISENLDVVKKLVRPYERYRTDYMKEGSALFNTICYKFSKMIEGDMFAFHYSTRMAVVNAPGTKEKYAELATMLYKVILFCKMADELSEFEAMRIANITGSKPDAKQVQSVRYNNFCGLVLKLYRMVGGEVSKADDKLTDKMVMAGQIILNKLTHDAYTDIICKSIVDMVYDYSYYCIARMLMDVRNTGAINPKDVEALKEGMDFTDEMIRKMTKELKATRINVTSGDAMEIKDYVPMMKKAIVVQNVFVKILAAALKVELLDNNPYTNVTN